MEEKIKFVPEIVTVPDDYIAQCKKECIEAGLDKYITQSLHGELSCKEMIGIGKKDIILYKISLTYRDKTLSAKIKHFDEPYRIYDRYKARKNIVIEGEPQKNKYYLLQFVKSGKYTIGRAENPHIFNTDQEVKAFISRHNDLPKFDREYYLGIVD